MLFRSKAGGDQGDANGAKDEADYKDYDRVECARLGRLEHRTRGVVNCLVVSGRLSLENFITLGKLHPRLLPASPYVSRGPQPGCIIQRAAPEADDAIPWHAANPRAALRANQSDVDASAIGGALKSTWLNPCQAEPLFRDNDPQGECAAGQALAIQAVTGIDRLRSLGDLVANLPALATARLWELHCPLLMTRFSKSAG